jgi:AsmA protein
MKNKPLVIVGVVVAVLLLIVLALPLFINANKFKPKLETQLTSALGRPVTIGNISLAILSGGVTVATFRSPTIRNSARRRFLRQKNLPLAWN